jgi:cytochrome P450
MSIPTDNDIVSPVLYSDEKKLYAMFANLRNQDPVRWVAPDDYRPFWAISKYKDIVEIETEGSQIFLARPRNRLFTKEEERIVMERTGQASILRSLPTLDAPDHRKCRAIFQEWFAPSNLKRLEEKIAQIVDERLDYAFAQDGVIDFVSDVALWVPLQTIMMIFGVPFEDGDRLHRLSAQLFHPHDPDTARQTEGHGTSEAAAELFQYFKKHIDKRRSAPTEDLLTIIANARVDGQPIEEKDGLSNAVTVFVGGHDTTVSTIAGGMHAIISHPACFEAMRAGSADIARVVEEVLRYVSPVRGFMRVANQDYQLRDKTIRAGEAVLLLYPAGNRDEEAFAAPDELRFDRPKTPHLAFGSGPHMCLGQMLARMELRAFFRRFFERVQSAELAGPTAWLQSNFLGGPKLMPVRLRAR